jgi:hypothetical protein
MIKFRYLLVICLAFVMSSCTHNMALTKGKDDVDLSKKSIALLFLRISNQKEPTYQLFPQMVFFEASREKVYELRGYNELYRSEKDVFNEYLLSFDLEPGNNKLKKIWLVYSSPIWGNARTTVPLDLKVDIKPNSVIYLGHMDIAIREKKNTNEESNAHLIPIIPILLLQAAAGLNGTCDVSIDDKYDDDIKAFITKYPGLKNVNIEKTILQQWERPENRKAK